MIESYRWLGVVECDGDILRARCGGELLRTGSDGEILRVGCDGELGAMESWG